MLALNLCAPEAEPRKRNPTREDFEQSVGLLMGGSAPEVLAGLAADDEGLHALVEAYRAEARLERPGMRTRLGALAAELLVQLARLRMRHAPDRAGDSTAPAPQRLAPRHYVERARELLHAGYRKPIRLDELATRVGLSVTHLHRLFVRQTKVTPMAYLRCYRLRRAGEMLAATGRSVAEISHEVGFHSAQRFTKAFHREYGCAPRDYRKAELKLEGFVL